MKTVRPLAIVLGLFAMACTAEASDVAATTPAVTAGKASCAASYREKEHAVNAENRWSYFKDLVRELKVEADGSAWVSFQTSTRRYKLAASEKSLIAAAKTAFEKKAPVHVAIEEGEESLDPAAPPGKPAQLRWLDPKEQHPSCR